MSVTVGISAISWPLFKRERRATIQVHTQALHCEDGSEQFSACKHSPRWTYCAVQLNFLTLTTPPHSTLPYPPFHLLAITKNTHIYQPLNRNLQNFSRAARSIYQLPIPPARPRFAPIHTALLKKTPVTNLQSTSKWSLRIHVKHVEHYRFAKYVSHSTQHSKPTDKLFYHCIRLFHHDICIFSLLIILLFYVIPFCLSLFQLLQPLLTYYCLCMLIS